MAEQYKKQAAKYRKNGIDLIELLDKVLETTNEVQGILDESYKDAKNDYFTNKINENNELVIEDTEEIKKKIDDVANNLEKKAEILDKEELEKEQLAKIKKDVQEKNRNDNKKNNVSDDITNKAQKNRDKSVIMSQ